MKYDVKQIIEDIEYQAKLAGMSVSAVCEKALIARSTFDRWKRGEMSPSIQSLNAIYKALEVENNSAKKD